MNKKKIARITEEANYIINTKETLRNVAKHFNISKSTVHKDMQERLVDISFELNQKVRCILNKHLLDRHIKGGLATKEKYKKGES